MRQSNVDESTSSVQNKLYLFFQHKRVWSITEKNVSNILYTQLDWVSVPEIALNKNGLNSNRTVRFTIYYAIKRALNRWRVTVWNFKKNVDIFRPFSYASVINKRHDKLNIRKRFLPTTGHGRRVVWFARTWELERHVLGFRYGNLSKKKKTKRYFVRETVHLFAVYVPVASPTLNGPHATFSEPKTCNEI